MEEGEFLDECCIHDTVTLLENFLLYWVGVWRGPAAQGVAFARPVMEWSLVCVINMYQIIHYYVDICLNFNVLYICFLP